MGFSADGSIRATIDGREVEPRVLFYWEMNPSSARSSCDWHRVEIHMRRSDFEALLGAEYEELRRDLAEDFVINPPDGSDEVALIAHETLHGLIDNAPEDLHEIAHTYLWQEMLERLFGSNAADELQYWIADLFEIAIEGDGVTLAGEASSRRAPQGS